jgi:hypothetical protein
MQDTYRVCQQSSLRFIFFLVLAHAVVSWSMRLTTGGDIANSVVSLLCRGEQCLKNHKDGW